MQNKPNVKDAQINVNSYMKSNYEKLDNWLSGKNKPNSNPIKPNQTQFAKRVKLMQSVYLQRIMKINAAKGYEQTNPNKPNSPPNFKNFSSQFC